MNESCPTRQPPTCRRVLIVDDYKDTTVTLAEYLSMRGYEVATAADAEGALRLATGFIADVALVDIDLPGMNGYELVERLRTLWPASSRFIALSGYKPDAVRSAEVGFQAHLLKPPEMDVLESLLGEPA